MSSDPRKRASLQLLIGVTGFFSIFCHVELVVWFSFLTWDGGGGGDSCSKTLFVINWLLLQALD